MQDKGKKKNFNLSPQSLKTQENRAKHQKVANFNLSMKSRRNPRKPLFSVKLLEIGQGIT